MFPIKYNEEAISRCIERDLPLWNTRKCKSCETFNDVVAFVDLESQHAVTAIKHGCAMPITLSAMRYAAKLMETS